MLPLPEAQSALTYQINIGFQVAQRFNEIFNDASYFGISIHQRHVDRLNVAIRLCVELEQWRDFSQSWLGQFLGGGAADEFREIPKCIAEGQPVVVAPEPYRHEIDTRIIKLQSILNRLPLWVPVGGLTPDPLEAPGLASSPQPRPLPSLMLPLPSSSCMVRTRLALMS